EVVANCVYRTRSARQFAGDHTLDLARTRGPEVPPIGFPSFQGLDAVRNGVSGEHRIVQARPPDTDKILQELRANDDIVELSARALTHCYVPGTEMRKNFNKHLIW
ncbi:hypothetical protein BC826DRAFT_1053335, partial [Russula brevipes]